MKYIRSFLKWPGGKFRILPKLLTFLPSGKQLLEPFVGAGTVFLNAPHQHYLLNDLNPDLINVYQLLKKSDETIIKQLKVYFTQRYNSENRYYALRAEFNKTTDRRKKCILFIYLNRHGYNGLCRYNRSHEFNVPFGRYKKPYFPEKELLHFIEKAQSAQFFCLPFEEFLKRARHGDIVYCDPPYFPLSQTAQFTAYHSLPFDAVLHQSLADIAEELSQKKIPVILSNHDTPFTRTLYKKAQLKYLNVPRMISCQGSNRKAAKELLALYYGS